MLNITLSPLYTILNSEKSMSTHTTEVMHEFIFMYDKFIIIINDNATVRLIPMKGTENF